MSNISLVLSSQKLQHEILEPVGQIGSVYLHAVTDTMGCCLQIFRTDFEKIGSAIHVGDPRQWSNSVAEKAADEGDMFEIETQRGPESLLVLSQTFHRDWSAAGWIDNAWSEIATVEVNGVFQGAILPEGTKRVRFRFNPYVRHAWLSHLIYAGAFLAILVSLRRRRGKAI